LTKNPLAALRILFGWFACKLLSRVRSGCSARLVVLDKGLQTGFEAISNFREGILKMKSFAVKQIMLGLAVTALVAGSIPLAAAQDASGAAATAAPAAASSAKPTKAERKEARKQARAKKNAELKKLEDAGYQPAQNDPTYPDKLQKAEKKAGVGAGASQ
jgi:ribosomal protein L12E/L44/L45/RPP1/RPP2